MSATTAGRGRPAVAGKNACTTLRPRSAGVPACSRWASSPDGVVRSSTKMAINESAQYTCAANALSRAFLTSTRLGTDSTDTRADETFGCRPITVLSRKRLCWAVRTEAGAAFEFDLRITTTPTQSSVAESASYGCSIRYECRTSEGLTPLLRNPASTTGDMARVCSDTDRVDGDTAHVHVNTPRVRINTPRVRVNTPRVHVNTPRVRVNIPRVRINTARVHVNTTRVHVNTARVHVNTAHVHVNTARVHVNTAHVRDNTARVRINTARVHTNTTHVRIDTASVRSDMARGHADMTHVRGDTARVHRCSP